MKKFFKIIVGIAAVLIILGVGGCAIMTYIVGSSIDDTVTEMNEETESADEQLQAMLEKATFTDKKDEFSWVVEVLMENNTERDFDYIEIEYAMFDAEGVKIGSSFTNITDIKAGESFRMELDLYEEGVASYEVTKISSSAL